VKNDTQPDFYEYLLERNNHGWGVKELDSEKLFKLLYQYLTYYCATSIPHNSWMWLLKGAFK
jgi:hypothetical protein